MNTPLWGIDLGGTKIEGVVLKNGNSLETLARPRVPTEANQGYKHIVNQIVHLVEKMKAETGLQPKSIGFGTPGSLDPATRTMKNSNTTCLNGQPFHRDLEKHLGVPVFLANDANCFAVAEANLGIVPEAVPDAKVVFGVIMGTGVGGGLVINGQVLNGKNGIGGEWGHNFLDASGGDCYCGKSGCVEQVLSGPALQRYYESLTGEKHSMKQIIQLYHAKSDSAATQTIERMLEKFGQAISVIINIIDPDAIVLGGGLGNIDLLYTEGVEATRKHIFNPFPHHTPFLKPKLGDSAGVFGAALLTLKA
ncbi:MAG: ROK family protein [Bacteroidota bacterium]